MAVTNYTLTVNAADLLGGAYDPTLAAVTVFVDTNLGQGEAIIDTTTGQIRLGPYRQKADSSGVATFAGLIGSDSAAADLNLAAGSTLQYRVRMEYVDAVTRRRGQMFDSGWFELTADANLASDITIVDYAPISWQSTFTASMDAIKADAQASADAAQASADQASAITGLTGEDDAVSLLIDTPSSQTAASLSASIAQVAAWARNPDQLIAGAITRDANGAATSAPVVWPDDSPGTYTADTVSTAFPGAVDGYHITYGSPVTMTFTQPTVTRDGTTGAVTNAPAIVVS